MGECLGCAFVYSGRPNPTWPVDKRQAESLEAIWEELEPTDEDQPAVSRLGYRGCSLTCGPDREFTSCRGTVSRRIGKAVQRKRDRAKRFERLLLATAPEGLLPSGLEETQNTDG